MTCEATLWAIVHPIVQAAEFRSEVHKLEVSSEEQRRLESNAARDIKDVEAMLRGGDGHFEMTSLTVILRWNGFPCFRLRLKLKSRVRPRPRGPLPPPVEGSPVRAGRRAPPATRGPCDGRRWPLEPGDAIGPRSPEAGGRGPARGDGEAGAAAATADDHGAPGVCPGPRRSCSWFGSRHSLMWLFVVEE